MLAGATDAITAAVRQTGLAREIYRESCPPASADAAVVFRDSDLSITAVVAMLAPGGVLYWEVSRARPARLWVTPAHARVALRRQGMTPIESYWVTSGTSGPSMHLPLSRDGALAWYFAVHHGPSSRLRRILGRVLRSLAQGRARRLERIVPVFAITARRDPDPPDGTEAAPGATALATADVPAWAVAADARPIVLGGGEGPWSRVVLLPFGRGADRPTGVIKVARSSAYEGGLAAEQRALASLRATVPASIRTGLPEPLGPARVLGQPGSAETYRPGASIAARSTRFDLRRGTRRSDLERAAGWLRDLHVATASGSVSLGPTGLDVGGLIDRYTQVFGSDETEDRLFRRLRAAIEDDHPVPRVMRHRDFGPWNVLVDTNGQLSVIDWEVAGSGPPLVDLVYFVAHWTWIVVASSSVHEDAQLLGRLVAGGSAGWHTTAGRSVIARHARDLGLAADPVAVLFAWTFIEQALDRHDRLAAIGDPTATARSSNRYVGYVAALAELPHLAGSIAGWLESPWDPGS
jgi:aminoglycoside phosphotransferase (APT) family kinase protein